jgi:ATP-dependent Clp protease protease subunit
MKTKKAVQELAELLSQKNTKAQPEEIEDIFQIMPFGNFGHDALSDRGILFIDDLINKMSVKQAFKSLIELHFNEEFTDTVQIIINSPGGYTDAGWAFIDLMKFVKNPIRTIAIGESASMATMIFVAGDERVMSPNSSIMIHNFSAMHAGTHDDLIANRKADDIMNKKILEHFKKYSNLKTDKLVKQHLLTGRDNFLTPQEALEFGLCDKISSDRKLKNDTRGKRKPSKG